MAETEGADMSGNHEELRAMQNEIKKIRGYLLRMENHIGKLIREEKKIKKP